VRRARDVRRPGDPGDVDRRHARRAGCAPEAPGEFRRVVGRSADAGRPREHPPRRAAPRDVPQRMDRPDRAASLAGHGAGDPVAARRRLRRAQPLVLRVLRGVPEERRESARGVRRTVMLRSYATWVIRHRWTVVGGVLLGTLLLTLAATRLHVEIDPDRQLPQDHPFIQTLNDVHRLFGDKNLVVIGLFPHDGNVFTPAFLHKLAEVTERLRHVPGANQALLQSLAAPQVKDIRGTADGMEVERVMETPPDDAAGAEAVRQRTFANDAYVGTLVAPDGSAAAIQASFELTPTT